MATEVTVTVGSTAKQGGTGTLFKSDKRVVRNGAATNELVLSAYVGGNEHVFPLVMDLYVSPGSVVADVTYGKGVFWKNIPTDRYVLLATDIQDGVDCRDLPYDDGEIDCVVLDPPYMHSPGGTAHRSHQPFEAHYRNNGFVPTASSSTLGGRVPSPKERLEHSSEWPRDRARPTNLPRNWQT